jgi:hypothetical protein
MATLLPNGKQSFTNSAGAPLVGGKLYTYDAGTNNPSATYQDAAGTVPNTNPVILDARGEALVFWSGTYKVVLKDAADVTIWTVDQVSDSSLLANQILTRLASGASAADGAGMVAFSYARNYVAGTLGSLPRNFGLDMTQPPFSCDPTGAVDCSAAANLALTSYPGVPLLFGHGTFRFDSTVSIKPAPSWGVFGFGALIRGCGVGSTFFDNRVANGPLFDIDSDSHGGSYHANMGTVLEHFNIITTTSPVASTGIRVLNGYQVTISNIVIKGMTQDGIELKNGAYTDDGWNRVAIIQVWLDTITRWGIKADGTAGRNEGSYTYLRQVFFQACGTASAATPPPSGGMIWKGQVLVIESSGAANGCQNVALFIKGESGLANTVDIRNWASENTVKRGLYCTGIDVFKGRNIQIYQNDTYQGTVGMEFDSSAYTVRNVDIDGAVVRATVGNNAFTAFKISGANATLDNCRVRNVSWENFDFAGQTRFSGWQFDTVPMQCELAVLDTVNISLRPKSVQPTGNKMPYRLRSGPGGSSSTGEWVAHEIASGGLNKTNAGLAASTRYYVYLYDNAGFNALELSTTAPVTDASTGYPVKTGDATRLYVGSVQTDAGSLFMTAASGWLNPTAIADSQTGTYSYMWFSSTSAALRYKRITLPTSDTDGVLV